MAVDQNPGNEKLVFPQVGGSLCGLMHGVMIKRLGHNVRILEQSLSSIRQGQAAGITAGAFVQTFLKRYDLTKEPWSVACPGLQFIDKNMTVKEFRKTAFQMASWNVLYYRLRANFDGFVSDYCETATVNEEDGKAMYELGKRVTDVSYAAGLVTLTFDDILSGRVDSLKADLVIAADGYFAWRGTIIESAISEESAKLFNERTTLFFTNKSYIVLYVIPGDRGSLKPGERMLNFVWYCNCPSTPQEFADIMTDIDGHQHRHTLPAGKMRDDIWAKQREYGSKILPALFIELINNIAQPFVTAISDTISPQAAFFDGKLMLVGDAIALFRPNIAQSKNQAAFNCLMVEKVLKEELSANEWETQVLNLARATRLASISWGTYYLSGYFAYFINEIKYRFELATQRWARS